MKVLFYPTADYATPSSRIRLGFLEAGLRKKVNTKVFPVNGSIHSLSNIGNQIKRFWGIFKGDVIVFQKLLTRFHYLLQ
jgi:hypothetical protein